MSSMLPRPRPLLPYGFAKQHGVIELAVGLDPAQVGLRDDRSALSLAEARRVIGVPLNVRKLGAQEFDSLLGKTYSGLDIEASEQGSLDAAGGLTGLLEDMPPMADILESEDDAPIVRLINGMIAEAARLGASDVHVEPYDSHLVVRLRRDGVLQEAARLNVRLAPLIVSRIKVMARLDIAERRLPQDGRLSIALAGRAMDVRVSTLPSKAGERVVLRLLDRDLRGLSLEELGMPAPVLSAFQAALREPNGIVLVTGPTGAGKTTTLYSGLRLLNDGARSILTIEDPIEYAVEGVGQSQVNAKVGMSFAAGLRAILRQDPDVVMVGEIRDAETAQIAVQASLTGHLVLSTVHTNDALGALTRLRDFGVEPFLLGSTVRVVLAQRLVRRLCPHCRERVELDPTVARSIGLDQGAKVFRAVGCKSCNGTGYVGRTGVYEAVRVDEPIRRLIAAGASETELADVAFGHGSATLQGAARQCLIDGTTSVEEALRIIRPEGNQNAAV